MVDNELVHAGIFERVGAPPAVARSSSRKAVGVNFYGGV